jgi:hypothetical protein
MERNNINKYPCPSCGYLIFDEGPGSDEICKICFWQDDNIDLEKMYKAWGSNKVSLEEGQKNFERIGAVEERFVDQVCPVSSKDIRESKWRMLDRSKDIPREIDPSKTDFKDLYYWYWN